MPEECLSADLGSNLMENTKTAYLKIARRLASCGSLDGLKLK